VPALEFRRILMVVGFAMALSKGAKPRSQWWGKAPKARAARNLGAASNRRA